MNDGSLLFLQHMIDKFEPVRPAEHKHGSRLAIVFSGSPLFTGGAGSGESDIRKWIIENDWLEAIIALPEQMFYNTGIGTYVWIVTNRKEKRRKGKIQLLDARDVWTAGGSEDNKRSLGDKRRHITASQIAEIVKLYGRQTDGETSKTFDNADFGYTRVTVERPLRLRYQMTLEDKARFLDACPHLLDDVQAIDKALGREPQRDWNAVWSRIEDLLHARKSRWKATEQKLFRSVFTQKDPEAEPVAKGGRDDGLRARRRPARFRERAAQGRHRRLLRARGAPARARRLDGPNQGQGRLRDQLQPPLLQVHAAAAAGGDRRGAEAGGGRDHAVAAGGDGVTVAASDGNEATEVRRVDFGATAHVGRRRTMTGCYIGCEHVDDHRLATHRNPAAIERSALSRDRDSESPSSTCSMPGDVLYRQARVHTRAGLSRSVSGLGVTTDCFVCARLRSRCAVLLATCCLRS